MHPAGAGPVLHSQQLAGWRLLRVVGGCGQDPPGRRPTGEFDQHHFWPRRDPTVAAVAVPARDLTPDRTDVGPGGPAQVRMIVAFIVGPALLAASVITVVPRSGRAEPVALVGPERSAAPGPSATLQTPVAIAVGTIIRHRAALARSGRSGRGADAQLFSGAQLFSRAEHGDHRCGPFRAESSGQPCGQCVEGTQIGLAEIRRNNGERPNSRECGLLFCGHARHLGREPTQMCRPCRAPLSGGHLRIGRAAEGDR